MCSSDLVWLTSLPIKAAQILLSQRGLSILLNSIFSPPQVPPLASSMTLSIPVVHILCPYPKVFILCYSFSFPGFVMLALCSPLKGEFHWLDCVLYLSAPQCPLLVAAVVMVAAVIAAAETGTAAVGAPSSSSSETGYKNNTGASLVAQCLRIRLPMQGKWVRALVREDPTCCGATKPVRHNY